MPLVCFWKDASQNCCMFFFPHASGFGGCRGCGTCFTCPYFQRRQFLLLSSHRQGKPGKEWTKQQQNLSFFTMRVIFTTTGTGCLEWRWIPQSYKYSRLGWLRLGATWTNGRCPCPCRGVGQMLLKVPSSQTIPPFYNPIFGKQDVYLEAASPVPCAEKPLGSPWTQNMRGRSLFP